MGLTSLVNRLFQSGNAIAPIAETAQDRADGYSAYNAKVICAFQAEAEKHNCDYTALKDTLAYARSINDYKLTPIGLQNRYKAEAEYMLADRK